MASNHPARALLAAMGANLSSIDGSFTSDYMYGDNTRYRASARDIERADMHLCKQAGIMPRESALEIPIMNMQYNQNISHINENRPSREERINKLLGKNTQNQVQQIVQNDEYLQMVSAIKEAVLPLTEQLEDIAILNGLLVQRIEQLIKIVDPDANNDEQVSEQGESFQKMQEDIMEDPLEVYNPDVSMSVLEDEETTENALPKKRNKKK